MQRMENIDGFGKHHHNQFIRYFSAVCFYTAQMLTDKYGMSDINFGLIDTAVGGSIIESWIKNFTVPPRCVANTTSCPGSGCGGLYNGQVLPWINMTIKAALWYMLVFVSLILIF